MAHTLERILVQKFELDEPSGGADIGQPSAKNPIAGCESSLTGLYDPIDGQGFTCVPLVYRH